MSVMYRTRQQLRGIETGLVASDPKLAGILSVFGRLCAGQPLPAWEQMPSLRSRIQQAAALLVATITVVTAAISSDRSFAWLRTQRAQTAGHQSAARARREPRPKGPATRPRS
jgi:hypothetical protein